MDGKDIIESLLKDARDYFNTSQQLLQLQLIEKFAKIVAAIISLSIVFSIFAIAFLFGSIALAHVFASWLHQEFLGYFLVAILYLLIGVFFFKNVHRFLIKPIMNKMIKQILGNE